MVDYLCYNFPPLPKRKDSGPWNPGKDADEARKRLNTTIDPWTMQVIVSARERRELKGFGQLIDELVKAVYGFREDFTPNGRDLIATSDYPGPPPTQWSK
jgi:hypothetical protein